MKLADFDYELPPELVAQEPLADRGASRLLHLSPDGSISHDRFESLPDRLESGDLLVVNDTKVFPARLTGSRPTGGGVELLLLESLGADRWRVLAKPARRLRVGMELDFGDGELRAQVMETEPCTVRFHYDGPWAERIDALGRTPLPPYIAPSRDEAATRRRYQTVYAVSEGSVAAPTAGLHFTPEILSRLKERGVGVAALTLHVGYATFAPIRVDDVEAHRMGTERYSVPEETVRQMRASRRVVAVGTTTVRALESAARKDFAPGWHETELFITPGFEFRVVSGMVTNFHLPKSTLLLLVSALGGVDAVRRAYREAVAERYRFYSFGDAMLLYHAAHGASGI